MASTVIARTRSGSCYVLALASSGVRWYRVPGTGSLVQAATGSEPFCPRVVPGERLLLGGLRSTPITEVAFIPDYPSRTTGMPEGLPSALLPWVTLH